MKCKNIEWWKNIKHGDEFELDVMNDINNEWCFIAGKGANKKYKTVYFDGIWYPPDDIKKYSDPMLIFQVKKEEIGNKMTHIGLALKDLKSINSHNGEKVEKEKKVKKNIDDVR